MDIKLLLKLNFLILGLVIVLILMNSFGNDGIGSRLLSAVGIDIGTQKKWDWCETRVSKIEWNHKALEQVGFKWILKSENQTELDFVSIEKWFGMNCKVNVEPLNLDSLDLSKFSPFAVVQYVKGTSLYVLKDQNNTLLVKNSAFKSIHFLSALDQIPHIPQRGP